MFVFYIFLLQCGIFLVFRYIINYKELIMIKLSLADVVETLPLFAEISGKEKTALLQVAKLRNLAHGQLLFIQGDPMIYFHIIYSGTIQLFRETADGYEITPAILIAGDSLCPAEVVETAPFYHVNAKAVDDAILFEVPMDWLKANLKDFNHLILKLFSDVSHRLQESTLEVERQATMSAVQLVTCFLHDICVRYNFDPKGFELPYSKTLIASRLGMELETLSRSLHKLKDYGITVQGTHVSFHDAQAVEDFACEYCATPISCNKHSEVKKKVTHIPQSA